MEDIYQDFAFQYGVIVVGGNSKYDVSFCLHSLALKQQCILGVSKGTRDQLEELVQLVADNKAIQSSSNRSVKTLLQSLISIIIHR